LDALSARLAGHNRIAGDVLVLGRQVAHESAPDRGEYREVAGVVTAQDVMREGAILPADKQSDP
jgi:hypothetical protein